jgi:hypothetical protein
LDQKHFKNLVNKATTTTSLFDRKWEAGAAYLLLKTMWERLSMKKNEFSETVSNLLIVGSVSLAFAPFLLGDQLGVVVSGLMRDGAVLITQFSNYVTWLIS